MKKIDILGLDYEIEFMDKYPVGNLYFGYCNFQTQVIGLLKEQKMDSMFNTLIHEILHVISFIQNVDLDEHEVTLLAAGLSQVLKKNDLINDIILENYEVIDNKEEPEQSQSN